MAEYLSTREVARYLKLNHSRSRFIIPRFAATGSGATSRARSCSIACAATTSAAAGR